MRKLNNHILIGFVAMVSSCLISWSAHADTTDRGPANYIPDDEVSVSPIENTLWVDRVIVKDDAGVLETTANDIQRWQDEEEFRQNWGVNPLGAQGAPNQQQKRSYIERQALKYLDKRLTGEVKRAEKGSTLHKVGTVQKALKPSSTVQISKKFKLRFKAKLLQRQATVYVINPYVNNSLDVNDRGQAVLRMSNKVKPLQISSDLRVDFHNSTYASSLSRPVSKKVRAIISTHQRLNQAPFESNADNRLEFRYFTAF